MQEGLSRKANYKTMTLMSWKASFDRAETSLDRIFSEKRALVFRGSRGVLIVCVD